MTEEAENPEVVEYPFVLRSLTLRDVGKLPGPVQYSSREYGTPYATFDVNWSAEVVVEANPDDPLVEVSAALGALMKWFQSTGAKMGREVLADIELSKQEARLGIVPSVDANEL